MGPPNPFACRVRTPNKIKDKRVARLQEARNEGSMVFQTLPPASRILHPRRHTLATKPNQPGSQHLTVLRASSGDHTGKETPVPIPNTAVKLSGPMIVPTSAKVGIARFYYQKPRVSSKDSREVFALNAPPLKAGARGGMIE